MAHPAHQIIRRKWRIGLLPANEHNATNPELATNGQ
jgi:hypothetical protein